MYSSLRPSFLNTKKDHMGSFIFFSRKWNFFQRTFNKCFCSKAWEFPWFVQQFQFAFSSSTLHYIVFLSGASYFISKKYKTIPVTLECQYTDWCFY